MSEIWDNYECDGQFSLFDYITPEWGEIRSDKRVIEFEKCMNPPEETKDEE